ncbi:BREX system ATP-binding domain-containing protein [Mycolicibacterium psychrotolerans]|uniref:BREX system ATP-binding domain-containing protein n=1 Tax=Mycolicibacterium psychrotolerans TaxID=216929 RepID=UPI003D674869
MIPLHPEDWVTVVAGDLVEFVGEGGALVRFVVGDTHRDITLIGDVLEQLAADSNLFFFNVDSAERRIHYTNDLLSAVARQLDLRSVITEFLIAAIVREGFDMPADATSFVLNDVARVNDLIPADVVALLNQRIRAQILSDRRVVRDLRYALSAMAAETLRGDEFGTAVDLVGRWLDGKVSRITELREFGIVQKVSRYNARALLRSVLTWLPAAGRNGSILYVNAERLGWPKNPRDGYVFYARAALSDAYEVMREFIDDTDEMHNVMIVFAMPSEFLSIDPTGRGMGYYQALQHRVSSFAEATLPNPLANMVLLSSKAAKMTIAV